MSFNFEAVVTGCRFLSVVDDLAAYSSSESEQARKVAERLAKESIVDAQRRAAETGKAELLTADNPVFEGLYADTLRNSRVPVAAVSPTDAWNWAGPYAPVNILLADAWVRVSAYFSADRPVRSPRKFGICIIYESCFLDQSIQKVLY